MFISYIENISPVKSGNDFLIIITGWAFDDSCNISVKVDSDPRKQCNTQIAYAKWHDVQRYHNNACNSLNSGFVVEISNIPKGLTCVELQFCNDKGEVCHQETIQIQECINKRYPHLFSWFYFRKVIDNLRDIGLLSTLKLIYNKLFIPSTVKDETDAPYIFFKDQYSYPSNKGRNICAIVNATNQWADEEQINLTLTCLMEQKVQQILLFCQPLTPELGDFPYPSEVIICMSDVVLTGAKELLRVLPNIPTCDFITVIDAGDTLTQSAIERVLEAFNSSQKLIITGNEDRDCDGKYIAPFYKKDLLKQRCNIDIILRKCMFICPSILSKYLAEDIGLEEIEIIDKTLYHYVIRQYQIQVNKVKPIAFYLPQFHTFPENDEWWGKGFTEWTNTRRGKPAFEGHYQPHDPGELGYYDLVNDIDIIRKQINLAKQYGIYGFCFYYYWFNGKKLMEKPLERILQDKELDFPFCICWANETWSRRWDGQESQILIKQEHSESSDKQFIEEIIPILKDPRYITVNGAPLLIVYRVNLFEDFSYTADTWRKICKEHGINELKISMVQSFGINDPNRYGADAAIEFPPHGVVTGDITSCMPKLAPDFEGHIYDYRDVVSRMSNKRVPDYKLYRGIMLSWDNTARRQNRANIFAFADDKAYYEWLCSLIDYTSAYLDEDEQFIFINAWNEWAEGTHLEPDKKNGYKYLDATQMALKMNC